MLYLMLVSPALGIRFFKRVSVLLWVRRLYFFLAGDVSVFLSAFRSYIVVCAWVLCTTF